VWQCEIFALLQATQQESDFQTCGSGKWRRLDFAVQPTQRFVAFIDDAYYMSFLIYEQGIRN